ncbi:hypothetical protein X777_16096, partial [Ooceraea biroi]
VAATTTGGTTSGSPAPSATVESTTFLTFMDSALLSDELSGSPFCAAVSSSPVVSFDDPSFSPLLCNLSSNTGTSASPFCVVPLSFCFSESTAFLSFVSTTVPSFTVAFSFAVSCCAASLSRSSTSAGLFVSPAFVSSAVFSSVFSACSFTSKLFSVDTLLGGVASSFTFTVVLAAASTSATVGFAGLFSPPAVSTVSPFSVRFSAALVCGFAAASSGSLFAETFSLSAFDSSFASSFSIFKDSSDCVSFTRSVEPSVSFSEDVAAFSDADADSGTDMFIESSAVGAIASEFSSVFSDTAILVLSFVALSFFAVCSSLSDAFGFSLVSLALGSVASEAEVSCSTLEESFSTVIGSSACAKEHEAPSFDG